MRERERDTERERERELPRGDRGNKWRVGVRGEEFLLGPRSLVS